MISVEKEEYLHGIHQTAGKTPAVFYCVQNALT